MTELWWWVEPLFKTGIVTLVIACFAAWIGHDCGDWLFWICVILMLPLAVCFMSVVVWFFINLFLHIWQPYF